MIRHHHKFYLCLSVIEVGAAHKLPLPQLQRDRSSINIDRRIGHNRSTTRSLELVGHARIRKELGYGELEPDNIRDMLAQRYQGSRYSFGYPACPNVADQLQQLEIMGTQRMGLSMDESEQLYPEQSTTALIVYHPVAKYFSA